MVNAISNVFGYVHHIVNVDLKLGKGQQKLTAWFTDDPSGQSKEKAAFYVYVEKR